MCFSIFYLFGRCVARGFKNMRFHHVSMGQTWSNDQKHKNNEKVSQLESGNWTLDTGHWTVQRTLDSVRHFKKVFLWNSFELTNWPLWPKVSCSPRPTFKLKHNSTVEKRRQSHFKKTQFHHGEKKAAVAFKKTHVGEKRRRQVQFSFNLYYKNSQRCILLLHA